jgi:solute carrier family 35 protein E1
MPHSTRASSATRVPTFKFANETKPTALRTSMETSRFPDFDTSEGQSPYLNNGTGFVNSPSPLDRWQPRRDSTLGRSSWANGQTTGGKHSRQKSLSDAFRTIRTRNASVSANVHEISDALKAPVSPKLIVRKPPQEPPYNC